ncbi:type II toxin-antitoxin system HicA family toxin [Thiocapsa roseopersicina]|uniref:type II toxin-antitoxin system HicA family toxin n=1 Tax=Thiocapsa roseopersicina TaxID=1058 RepID=UPI002481E371|nr:type II toxin-antitoxin system HicA family toxin [Thiocapsa roseopersicina]
MEALLVAVGCLVIEGSGSAVTFEKDGRKANFHRPHPRKEAPRRFPGNRISTVGRASARQERIRMAIPPNRTQVRPTVRRGASFQATRSLWSGTRGSGNRLRCPL